MKRTYELIAPCHFGLEAVLKKEILDLGYEISLVEDGRVTFIGDDEAICRANVFLRTAERILLKAGSFEARTFDELTGVLGLLYHREKDEIPEKVKQLAEERAAARKEKNWARADAIRDELASMGYAVEDTANGPKIVKK